MASKNHAISVGVFLSLLALFLFRLSLFRGLAKYALRNGVTGATLQTRLGWGLIIH